MEDGDLWADAEIGKTVKYLAKSRTKLQVPVAFADVFEKFVEKL